MQSNAEKCEGMRGNVEVMQSTALHAFLFYKCYSVSKCISGGKCRVMQRNVEKCRGVWSDDALDSLSHYTRCQCSAEYPIATLSAAAAEYSHSAAAYSAEPLLCREHTLQRHYYAENTLCRDTTLQSILCKQLPLLCEGTFLVP